MAKSYLSLFILIINLIIVTISSNVEIDPNGYIAYCPCMGRFGNQADHFLGSLGFAHNLNRTLILPPWVEYRFGNPKSTQIPFDTYFKLDPLKEYHRVITMEKFMNELSDKIWPVGNRTAFCYMARTGKDLEAGCNPKEGNPFGPFWDTFNVDFSGSEFYSPLHYDTYNNDLKAKWNARYPSQQWPVLAFTGAPANFPVQLEYRHLQKYLKWSDIVLEKARNFIKNTLPRASFIGIHLRNGMDWIRACDHIKQTPNLFSAPQCLGYRNEKGPATLEMCLPPKELIVKQLKRQIKNMKGVKSIFVASDSNHMVAELNSALKRMKVSVYKMELPDPHVELAVMGLANHFIGNCISSFTAFVKRDRDSNGLPSSFWGFPTERSSLVHEEL